MPLLQLCAIAGTLNFSGMEEEDKWRKKSRYKAVQCYWRCQEDLPKAIALFQEEWNKQYDPTHPHYISDVRGLITYNVAKLAKHFTLEDLKGHGRPTVVPDDVAKECAALLAAGYLQKRYALEPTATYMYYEHCWFTSMRDAVMQTPRLQQVLEEYDVTADHLLRRMHHVDPQLVYGPLRMKGVLPEATKQQRVFYSETMLWHLAANPNFLLDVFWMDECRIWVGKDLFGRLKVWSHRGDMEGEPPEPNPFMGRGKSFKINLLLVVNARHGCVWAELLSGTTGLAAGSRHNPEMRAVMQLRNNQPYKVSYLNMMQLDSR